jgi:uncharacterized protein YggL (DUF469 family)
VEHGFAVSFRLSGPLPEEAEGEFWRAFIEELIEPRGLAFGGGETAGYVTRFRGSATEEDREAVRAWLGQRTGVERVTIGPLEDAWCENASDPDRRRS